LDQLPKRPASNFTRLARLAISSASPTGTSPTGATGTSCNDIIPVQLIISHYNLIHNINQNI